MTGSTRLRSRTALVLVLIVLSGQACAQDAAAGKTVFGQCAPCHAVNDGNGIGPTLKGIEGRKAGSVAGFGYSRAMASAGYAWDAKSLDAFLAAPTKALPGNAMPFAGLGDATARANLIAYLQTLK